jgi:hypothetical protein
MIKLLKNVSTALIVIGVVLGLGTAINFATHGAVFFLPDSTGTANKLTVTNKTASPVILLGHETECAQPATVTMTDMPQFWHVDGDTITVSTATGVNKMAAFTAICRLGIHRDAQSIREATVFAAKTTIDMADLSFREALDFLAANGLTVDDVR